MKSRDMSFLSLCKFICHIQIGLLQYIWSLSYSVPKFPPRKKKGTEGFLSKRPPDGELQDNFTVSSASETLLLLWRDPWGSWDLEEIWSTHPWMPLPTSCSRTYNPAMVGPCCTLCIHCGQWWLLPVPWRNVRYQTEGCFQWSRWMCFHIYRVIPKQKWQ